MAHITESDVRYIVHEAVRDLRDEMQNEIDNLTGEIAKLHCRIQALEEAHG